MATTCLQGRITIPLPLVSIEFPWPVPLSMACMVLLGLTNSSRMYWICWSCFLIDVPSRTGVDLCNSKKKTADDLAKEALAPQFLLLGLLEVSVTVLHAPTFTGMIVDALCSYPICSKLHPWHACITLQDICNFEHAVGATMPLMISYSRSSAVQIQVLFPSFSYRCADGVEKEFRSK